MFVKSFARRRVSSFSHASGHAVIAASLLWGATMAPAWAQAPAATAGEAPSPVAASPEAPKPAAAAESAKPKAKPAVKPSATHANKPASKPASKTQADAKADAKADATPDEKSLIVANALGDSLTFLDPRTAEVQRTVRGIIDPYQLRFSPDMKWMVTAGNRLNHVDIYRWDGKDVTLSKRISTGKTPSHLWIDSTSSIVYSTMQDSDELVAIDLNTQTLKWRVKTGSLPADVYGSPDDKTLFIGLTGGEGVEVYDVSGGKEARLLKTIPTGKGAHAFRGAGDSRHIYVSNRVANTLSKIDMQTQTVVAQLPGPTGPDCMDVSADGRLILLSSRWGRKMTVIDTESRKVLRQISVGKSPHGVWTLDHAPR